MKIKLNSRTKQIILVSSLIFLFRYQYIDLLLLVERSLKISSVDATALVFTNFPLVILLVIIDFYVIRNIVKNNNLQPRSFVLYSIQILYLLSISIMAGIYVTRTMIWDNQAHCWDWTMYTSLIFFLINLFISVFINIQLYNKRNQEQALEHEKRKTFQAIHDYNRLKRQLNPHFLFNSLNVLNSMIHSDVTRASAFVQKMAKVYRYLLSQEEKKTVSFWDEFSFATAYFELMRERFGQSIELKIDVADSVMRTLTIPCSIQIQIENAVKHNIVDLENPLLIDIFVEDNWIIIRNNLIPKMQMPESTGVGLASIEAQYIVVFHKEIAITPNKTHFIVKLPIIHNT